VHLGTHWVHLGTHTLPRFPPTHFACMAVCDMAACRQPFPAQVRAKWTPCYPTVHTLSSLA